MKQELKDDAVRYVDNLMSTEEQSVFETRLQSNPQLMDYVSSLRTLAQFSNENPLEPSKNFTARVMTRLNDPQPIQQSFSFRNSIMLLVGILSILTIGVILLASGVFDHSTTLDPNNLGIVQEYLKRNLPKISIDGKLVVNIILVLNLALVFVLLDRVILRPLFQRRMHSTHS